jgi:hypothetical protein
VVVAPIAASVVFLAGSYVVGGLAGLVRLSLGVRSGDSQLKLLERTAVWALTPPMLWLALAGAFLTHSRAGAVVYLALVSVPAACLAGDRMCTHCLFWMSANHRIDLATLLTCRQAWRRRLWWCVLRRPIRQGTIALSPELLHVLRTYLLRGPAVLIAALLPAVVGTLVLRHADSATQCTGLLLAMTLGLSAVGLLGAARHRQPVRTFFRYLLNWLFSGDEEAIPPWVFRSPFGSPSSRQVSFVLALLFFTPAVLGLTNWLGILPSDGLHALTNTQPHPSIDLLGRTLFGLAGRLLLITTVPPILFVLTISAYAGPVICRLDDILEGTR